MRGLLTETERSSAEDEGPTERVSATRTQTDGTRNWSELAGCLEDRSRVLWLGRGSVVDGVREGGGEGFPQGTRGMRCERAEGCGWAPTPAHAEPVDRLAAGFDRSNLDLIRYKVPAAASAEKNRPDLLARSSLTRLSASCIAVRGQCPPAWRSPWA